MRDPARAAQGDQSNRESTREADSAAKGFSGSRTEAEAREADTRSIILHGRSKEAERWRSHALEDYLRRAAG